MPIGGHVPGSIGRLVELHARYYARNWRFGAYFEAKVAEELGELMARFDAKRDGFWVATERNEVVGGILVDGAEAPERARLRFFIVADSHQGKGLGERLLRTAMDFCRESGYRRVYLTTFAGLDAARKLYERHGFVLTGEQSHATWGVAMVEQRMEANLQH